MAHLSSFCSTVRRPRTAPLVPSTTLFRSPGLLVDLRRREPEIAAHARRVEQLRHPAGAAGVGADERDEHTEETTDQEPDGPVGTETISPEPEPEPEAETTSPRPRNQPRRSSRRRRAASRRGDR